MAINFDAVRKKADIVYGTRREKVSQQTDTRVSSNAPATDGRNLSMGINHSRSGSNRSTLEKKLTLDEKRITSKQTKTKTSQTTELTTLQDVLKNSWDVSTEYARTGKLNSEKVQAAAKSKVDLGRGTKAMVTGAAKSYGAGMANAGSTLLQALDTGTVSGKSREELVTAPKPQTVEQLERSADRLAESAYKDISVARETLGDLVTDVGVGLVQLGGDVAAGMLVPGGALISMSARAFGGKAQQVRQKGGSIDAQVAAGTTAAVTEFLLEKMFSVGKFQTKYFGEGAVDDILEGVVSAVEDLGKTESGKAWLNHLATGGVNFLSEGVEEGLSGMLEPVADRVIGKLDGYEDKPLDWKEIGKDAGHAFLVGGIIGALGGTVGGTDTGKGRETNVQTAKTSLTVGASKDIAAAPNQTQTRGVGRVAVDYEQFREEYTKRAPEATEEQTREQFELFKGYVSGQDVVETADGPLTRAEIKERLAGLQDEKEIDQLVDGLLDEREAQAARETVSPAHLDKDIDSDENGAHAAETALANKISGPYTESEVTTNVGEEVHLRDGGQWSGSADSGGQVSSLEEGAGRVEGWNTEGRPADREAAALTYAEEKVSARSLGITGGTADANIHVVTGGETESTRAAQQLANERGLELVLFTGGNLDIKKGGVVASARAYIQGNKVYIRADHPLYTADQLMRHETGHDMIARKEINPNTVRQRIVDMHGAEKLDELSRQYAEAYAGSGMNPAEIWEEIICDSLADMNIFTEQEKSALAHEVMEETKKPPPMWKQSRAVGHLRGR